MELIELTPAAKAKIEALQEAATNSGNPYLRLGSRGGGCGVAVSYFLGFDKAEESDKIVTINGINCVINKGQLMQLQGITLDYLDTEKEQGFKFSQS